MAAVEPIYGMPILKCSRCERMRLPHDDGWFDYSVRLAVLRDRVDELSERDDRT
jgi:hypothetical protein